MIPGLFSTLPKSGSRTQAPGFALKVRYPFQIGLKGNHRENRSPWARPRSDEPYPQLLQSTPDPLGRRNPECLGFLRSICIVANNMFRTLFGQSTQVRRQGAGFLG